jgi:hypothetical protein
VPLLQKNNKKSKISLIKAVDFEFNHRKAEKFSLYQLHIEIIFLKKQYIEY